MGISIIGSVKNTVTDLHNIGLVDDVTMKNWSKKSQWGL